MENFIRGLNNRHLGKPFTFCQWFQGSFNEEDIKEGSSWQFKVKPLHSGTPGIRVALCPVQLRPGGKREYEYM